MNADPDTDAAAPTAQTPTAPEPPAVETPTRFRAFISYSHRDTRWAVWLQRRLERYVIPPQIAARGGALSPQNARLRPIFRDRSDFSVGEQLEPATLEALDASAALIVICSPDSALSEHVNNEIKQFRARWPSRPIVPLLTRVAKNDVDASFPLALRYEMGGEGELSPQPREVLAADLREQGDGRDLALAKVIAALLDVAPDEVFQRQQRAARRRLSQWVAGLSAVAVLTAGLAVIAEANRREADRQRLLASAGELAARATAMRTRNNECSLALSVAALDAARAAGAGATALFEDAVRNTLARTRVVETIAPAAPRRPTTAIPAWIPDAADEGAPAGRLAFVDDAGQAMVWSQGAPGGGGFAAPLGRINAGPAPLLDGARGERARRAVIASEPAEGDGLAGAGTNAPSGPVIGLSWTANGASLAVIREGALEIWSGDAQRRLSILPARGVRSFVWSPDGTSALVGVEGAGVFRLEAATQKTERLAALEGPFGRGAAWSPGGDQMLIGANGVNALIRKVGDGAVETLTHPAPVISVAWSPDGGSVAVGLDNGQVWVWDPEERRRTEILNAHSNQVTDLRFSPDGRRLLTASHDGGMAVWDARDWRRELTLTGHTASVGTALWRPDGAQIASASVDGTVRIWSAGDGRGSRTWLQRPGWIWNVEWPGERNRLTATADRAILSGPAPAGPGDPAGPRQADATPPGRADIADQYLFGAASTEAPLYAYVDDQLLKVRDLDEDTVIFQEAITEEIGRPLTVALAPDGSLLALASLEGVFVWSVRGHRLLRSWPTPAVAVAIAPDARRLAAFDLSDAAVDLYDIDAGEKLRRLSGPSPDKAIWGLEWSRNGERLAAGSDDGDVHVWRIDPAGATHQRLSGHLADVKDVAWARGDQRLASASLDGTLRIWRASDGAALATIEAHEAGARSVAWRADGDVLASGGEDGAVRLFRAEFADVAELAAEQIAAGMTEAERADCLEAPLAARFGTASDATAGAAAGARTAEITPAPGDAPSAGADDASATRAPEAGGRRTDAQDEGQNGEQDGEQDGGDDGEQDGGQDGDDESADAPTERAPDGDSEGGAPSN